MKQRPERNYHKRLEPVGTFQERKHPYYSIWANMMARCYDINNQAFCNYGARGIKVCSRWWHFKNFVIDMGNKPSDTFTLDRINNNLGYNKDNCKWSDRSEQNLNRRLFRNNVTGYTGIVKIANRYEARVDYLGKRYRLGRFISMEAAIAARDIAISEIKQGGAPSMPNETVWSTSSTKYRGITSHKDGGYVVRITENGKRIYLGYFKNLEDAINAKLSRNTN